MRADPLFVDVALNPSDLGPDWAHMICVVVDVLRASSTIVTLLNKGCPSVYTVSAIAAARALALEKDLLLGGERDGLTVPGFDFGNSPFELQDLNVREQSAVLTTTNGTRVIQKAAISRAVLIGCYLNARACCQRALKLAREYKAGVGIICAGERGKFVLDDALCAGYLVDTLLQIAGSPEPAFTLSDAAHAARKLCEVYPDILSGFRESKSGLRLLEINREEDLVSCGMVNISEAAPALINSNPCLFQCLT